MLGHCFPSIYVLGSQRFGWQSSNAKKHREMFFYLPNFMEHYILFFCFFQKKKIIKIKKCIQKEKNGKDDTILNVKGLNY